MYLRLFFPGCPSELQSCPGFPFHAVRVTRRLAQRTTSGQCVTDARMRRNPIRPWDHRSEPNVSTVEHLISARSAHAEGVAFVSTDGSGVNARSAEEVAYASTGGSEINAIRKKCGGKGICQHGGSLCVVGEPFWLHVPRGGAP